MNCADWVELPNARAVYLAGGAVRDLSGHDVMEALGIGPGPMVGRALAAVAEAQAAGEIASREEALELALRLGCQGA
jgi:predicted RecA/RadA family phage recombinase